MNRLSVWGKGEKLVRRGKGKGAAYFILRGRERCLEIGMIFPLMQDHSLQLKKLISQASEDAMLKIRRPVDKRLLKSNCVLHADQIRQN